MPGDFGDSRGIKRGQVRESDHGDWERERRVEKKGSKGKEMKQPFL